MPRYSAPGSLPSDLFSGGAVPINTSPFTDYYTQTLARNQARNDAVTKFIGDYSNKLTPAGVASEDIPDFMKAKSDWQDFAMQNRKALANPSVDNGRAYTQAQRKYNDALSIAQRSKDKASNLLQLRGIVSDPNKAALLTDGTLSDIHNASRRVTDPEYAPIDYSHVKYNPKPWDTAQESKVVNTLAHFKGDEAFDHYEPAGNGMQVAHYKSELNPNQLMGIRQMATNEYHNNPGFKSMIDSRTDIHSTDYPQLNAAFKQKFGTDIHQPEDMATAYMLSINPNKETRVGTPTKIPISPERLSQISQQRQINVAGAKLHLKNDMAGKPGIGSDNIHQFTENLFNDAKNHPKTQTTSDGKVVTTGFKANLSDANLKLFAQKDPSGHSVTPSEIWFSPDGKTVTPKFNTSEQSTTGHTALDKSREKPMTRQEFDDVVGKHVFGTKALNQQSPPQPKKKDPLGIF